MKKKKRKRENNMRVVKVRESVENATVKSSEKASKCESQLNLIVDFHSVYVSYDFYRV